jgi:hypothetical protein
VAHEEVGVMPPKIGGTIWYFDHNHRVYRKVPGHYWKTEGGPIYREYWRPVEILSETRVSWLTRLGKCPKRGGRGWALTKREVDLDVWANENRHRIVSHVQRSNVKELATISRIMGYDPACPE